MSSIAVIDDFKELLSQAKTELKIKSLVKLGGKAIKLILGDNYDNYEILIKDNGDVLADDNIKLGNIYQDQQSLINRLQENSVTGGSAAFIPGTGIGVATKNAFGQKKKKKKSYKLSSLLNELQYPDKNDIFLKIKIKANRIFDKNPANWNDNIWFKLFKLYSVNSDEFFNWYKNNLSGEELVREMSDPDNKLDKWKKAFYFYIKKAKIYAKDKDISLYNKAVEDAKYYNEKYQNQTGIDLYLLGSKTSLNEIKNKEDDLNESISYNKFKTESKTRNKSESLHKAVKEVKKRISEINRLMEYTNRMRNELNEDGNLKYSRFTENAINQISTMVTELYGNVKKLKK